MNQQIISSDRKRAIVGMGETGHSVARYLHKLGMPFAVFDSRHEPPAGDLFKQQYPEVDCHFGAFSMESLTGFDELVLSPGVDPEAGIFPELAGKGINLIGDIELFAREVEEPIIGITGSNAKSTVTTLVGLMAKEAGMNVGVGGNLGTPALDLIDDDCDLYVLELSSFQLVTTQNLRAAVASILNLSQDHLDRHKTMLSYHQAKQRIYDGASHLVCNRQDDLTKPLLQAGQKVTTFGVSEPDLKQFGVVRYGDQEWLAEGVNRLMDSSEVAMLGRHNLENALSALAIGSAAGIPEDAMLTVLKTFQGLPHRCELVSQYRNAKWVNDSKATNAGAVIAALRGLSGDGKIILIAGGQAKGQDFSVLAGVIVETVSQLVLIGEDSDQIAQAVAAVSEIPTVYAVNMAAAVQTANSAANTGDVVLLSPGCASFDMFDGYESRGRAFVSAVEGLA